MEPALRIFSWTWLFYACGRSEAWSEQGFRSRFLRGLYLHGDLRRPSHRALGDQRQPLPPRTRAHSLLPGLVLDVQRWAEAGRGRAASRAAASGPSRRCRLRGSDRVTASSASLFALLRLLRPRTGSMCPRLHRALAARWGASPTRTQDRMASRRFGETPRRPSTAARWAERERPPLAAGARRAPGRRDSPRQRRSCPACRSRGVGRD
jgi:hypothetical protein